MVHVSSASAQLLQLTDGHVNHSRYQNTPGLYNRPMFNLSKALFLYIYVMRCTGCDEEYIGETGDSLRHRMTVHRQQIRNSNFRILHVSNHIATCARNCETPFKLFPLYKMKEADTTIRKMKESYFIDLFKPKLNRMF